MPMGSALEEFCPFIHKRTFYSENSSGRFPITFASRIVQKIEAVIDPVIASKLYSTVPISNDNTTLYTALTLYCP